MAVPPPKKSWLTRLGSVLRPTDSETTVPDAAAQRLIQWFQARAAQQGYTLSDGQHRAIHSLAQRVGALQPSATATVDSLYLYGAVGRGKSWLLDGFFEAVESTRKRRVHFHDFFQQLHEGMFRHQSAPDAMAVTLQALLADCQLLCFDEFHVHDIGDAMLISRLFQALFERGIILVITSNYPPEGLLPNPLYHQRFLPVIHLIRDRMHVLELDGDVDFRTQAHAGSQQRFTTGRYVWPGTAAQREALHLPSAEVPAVALTVGKRQLQARVVSERTVGFHFTDLCERPTAVMDYLALCHSFDDWIIDGLPLLEECSIAVQQRFINLIDVLYDQDKRLSVISLFPLQDALTAQAVDLMRTRSRLGQLKPAPG